MLGPTHILMTRVEPQADGTVYALVRMPEHESVVILHLKITALDFKYRPALDRSVQGWDTAAVTGADTEVKTLRCRALKEDIFLHWAKCNPDRPLLEAAILTDEDVAVIDRDLRITRGETVSEDDQTEDA